jgi:hypothetical protein
VAAPSVRVRRSVGILAFAIASVVCALPLIPAKASDLVTESVPKRAKFKKRAHLRVGLTTNAQASALNSAAVLDEARQAGAGRLREDFLWSVIEPQDDAWTWDRYDKLFRAAAKRGMRILPVLIDTPSWAGSAWNTIPADPSQYAEFTAKVVERYGPRGRFWRQQQRRCRRHRQRCRAHPNVASLAPHYFELWNEPYLDKFSAGGIDPGRYARLVKAAASAGRTANRKAKYLLAAEQAPSGDRYTFIDGMYSAVPDLNSYFDAVAVHPYSPGSSPDQLKDGWGFTERLDAIRAKLVAHGARDKPLWVTEIGWSTCPSSSDCVSEQKQAAYLARTFELLSTRYSRYVRAAFVYCRNDLEHTDPTDPLAWFGLVRLDGTHKPAYDVFRQLASAL